MTWNSDSDSSAPHNAENERASNRLHLDFELDAAL